MRYRVSVIVQAKVELGFFGICCHQMQVGGFLVRQSLLGKCGEKVLALKTGARGHRNQSSWKFVF